MSISSFRNVSAVAVYLLAITTNGQTILLFENHFSAPNQTPMPNCGPDLDATLVNTLWGGTGTGTGGGGLWAQAFTVETILINGPDNTYSDTLGIGGDYCAAMLSAIQDDKAALTLDCEALPFVNLYMDISSIDLIACGGPFGLAQPSFHITVFDSPGGVFDINAPGIMLDQDTLYGAAPGSDPYTFTWASVATGLDVSASTDGNVTVMLDLLTSGYAAFDNIVINASATPEGIHDATGRASAITVWPNPAGDHLWVSALSRDLQWSIHDGLGATLAGGSQLTADGLDLAWLAPGMYILQCNNPHGPRSQRFIKR